MRRAEFQAISKRLKFPDGGGDKYGMRTGVPRPAAIAREMHLNLAGLRRAAKAADPAGQVTVNERRQHLVLDLPTVGLTVSLKKVPHSSNLLMSVAAQREIDFSTGGTRPVAADELYGLRTGGFPLYQEYARDHARFSFITDGLPGRVIGRLHWSLLESDPDNGLALAEWIRRNPVPPDSEDYGLFRQLDRLRAACLSISLESVFGVSGGPRFIGGDTLPTVRFHLPSAGFTGWLLHEGSRSLVSVKSLKAVDFRPGSAATAKFDPSDFGSLPVYPPYPADRLNFSLVHQGKYFMRFMKRLLDAASANIQTFPAWPYSRE